MKFIFVVLTLVLFSCGGSLSSEQRKKMRENMESKSLKKVSDAELTEAAFVYARKITKIIEDNKSNERKFIDSLEKVYAVQILFMQPSTSELRAVERKIIEAYTSGTGSVDLGDNLQKMGNDSLLYTKPVMKERPDGSLEFYKALGIRLHKKAVVLSMKD
ncbi:MAG: hypothetical protein HYR67_17035 [Bacteroidetes bacterium]|nr:hypothetical protein [Bacteroidota bacterium]